MERQIIYILSTDYAGSHFLALQLGSHSCCASIGEVHHLRRHRRSLRGCLVCTSDDQCPVYRGVAGTPSRLLYHQISQNIASYWPDVSTLIDNSKTPQWAKKFLSTEGVTKKYIHLIRDPRALVRRWMQNHDTSSGKNKVRWRTARRCWRHLGSILYGTEANVYLWRWLYENQRITQFLRANSIDTKLVTYRDLVFHSDSILSDLMAWMNLEYEPSQTAYWSFEHHGSVKPPYMKKLAAEQPFHDQRWRKDLDRETLKAAASHIGIQEYVAEMGLVMHEECELMRADGGTGIPRHAA
jgi:hypothetical protein